MNVGWSPCSKSVGVNFVQRLSNALWYLDPHHSKFTNRSIVIPERFSVYTGYNDFRRKKEKEPRLSTEGLEQHIGQLSSLLMQPWMTGKRFEAICSDIEKLVDALHAYKSYLISQCSRVRLQQQAPERLLGDENNASLVTVAASSSCGSRYIELEADLLNSPFYEPLFFGMIVPL